MESERRTSYLTLLLADDEFYRSVIGTLRDVPPGWDVGDRSKLGNDHFSPRSTEERVEIISRFDQIWRAGRAVELYHLVDDELLASAKSLLLADADLLCRVVFDLTENPDQAAEISLQIAIALQERRSAN